MEVSIMFNICTYCIFTMYGGIVAIPVEDYTPLIVKDKLITLYCTRTFVSDDT